MSGGKYDRSCGGALLQIVYKYVIGSVGIFRIRIPRLLRKCVGIQPVQQFQIHAKPPERILRRMNMKICHAGNNECISIISHFQIRKSFRNLFKYTLGNAIQTYKTAILHTDQLIHRFTVTNIAF